MIKQNIQNSIDRQHDESRLSGYAENIYIPETEDELIQLVSKFSKEKTPFTVQGGLTSITGASVSSTKDVISIEKLNNIIDFDKTNHTVTVQVGLRLSELNEFIQKNDPLYKVGPNPTEPTATIGGLIATNAKGTNYSKYKSFGESIESIKILLPNGKITTISRGNLVFPSDSFTLDNGKTLLGLNKPNLYSGILGIHQNMDILDIFTGTEGILGIILEAKIKLTIDIENKYGVFFFFRNDKAYEFSKYLKNLEIFGDSLVCIEYFSKNALSILQSFKSQTSKLKSIQDFNKEFNSSIYLELENNNMDELENILFTVLSEFFNYGGLEEDTWAGVGKDEIEKFSLLRHSLPEAINTIVEKNHKLNNNITKIACDFKLDTKFDELFKMYLTLESKNIEHCLFGHIKDNHLHLNFMPKTAEEVETVYSIVDELAAFVSENSGCLAFENGIGKLKKKLIEKYIDKDFYNNAKIIKEILDPDYIFNRGNIL